MSKTLFDFQKQLFVGDIGEADFIKLYDKLSPKKSDDKKIDFFLSDGSTVELKTDTYDMEATPNFFMETLGNVDSGALGGPWRARQDKITYFVYYFKKNKTFFWFKTEQLCDLLETIITSRKLKTKTIWNKGWSAEGYAVPRESLESILHQKDTF